MMKKLSALTGLVITLSACGKAAPTIEAISATNDNIYNSYQSRIIGENNLIKVKKDGSNVDTSLRGYLDAFGIISLGEGVCSGTHLGNGYVLTAGHCLVPQGQQGILADKECSKVKVYWGYRGSPETGSPKPAVSKVSQCTKIVYAELSPTKDFAIFKVDVAPSISIPISKSLTRASDGTKLTIFGYPQGRPLEWSQYCKLTSMPSNPAAFAYQCDTEPGNSGSSVLAINSSGKPMVVGIHDAGYEDHNLATHLSEAIKTMKNKGFDLISATSKGISI